MTTRHDVLNAGRLLVPEVMNANGTHGMGPDPNRSDRLKGLDFPRGLLTLDCLFPFRSQATGGELRSKC